MKFSQALASSHKFVLASSRSFSQVLAGSNITDNHQDASLRVVDWPFYDNLLLHHEVSQIVVTALTTSYDGFFAVPFLEASD